MSSVCTSPFFVLPAIIRLVPVPLWRFLQLQSAASVEIIRMLRIGERIVRRQQRNISRRSHSYDLAATSLLGDRCLAAAAAASGGKAPPKRAWRASSSRPWVPPAYRGLERDVSKRGHLDQRSGRSSARDQQSSRFARDRRWKVQRPDPFWRGRPDAPEISEVERAILAKEEMEASISILLNDLMRLARQYRSHFHETAVASGSDDEARAQLSGIALQRSIHSLLKGIHQSDVQVVGTQVVQESEADFRSLCRTLQHLCSISCSLTNLSKYNDKDSMMYVDLAEFMLLKLVQLGQDRSAMVESTKQKPNCPHVAGVDESPRTVGGWFNRLVQGFAPALVSVQQADAIEESGKESGTVCKEVSGSDDKGASDDIASEATKRLFRKVMGSIASSFRQSEERPISMTHSLFRTDDVAIAIAKQPLDDRVSYEVTAQRMLDLLDRMPSSLPPDTEALRYVMEILCRAGTLHSARLCNKVFQRHAYSLYRPQFALVLEAYLEIAMRETDEDKLVVIVEEILDALQTQWNTAIPSHRMERIMHCSIVLNCMAVANMGRVPGMCGRGEAIAKRALGGFAFQQLQQELPSETAKIDTQTLPVANYLAQLYASAGDDARFVQAKRVLTYMMQHDKLSSSRFTVYPNVGTCNAILNALIQRHGFSSAEETTNAMVLEDFDYAHSIFGYMFGRGDTGCWPNTKTHAMMFRLLEAASPADVGSVAADILSTIETMQAWSETDNLELSTYHLVMRCWLKEAKLPTVSKSGSRIVACERALRLLKKLELRSIPIALSDFALRTAAVKCLYDINIRPVRMTYAMVLQICVETSDPEDHEKAAAVAVAVFRLMVKRGFVIGEDIESLLNACHSRLAPESANSKPLEEILNIKVSEDNVEEIDIA